MSSIESYYDLNAQTEWERLAHHRVEFATTQRALAEYLPPPPARILDCGGGPGRYSILLASQGYEVTLLDLSQGNLALAQANASRAGVEIAAFVHGNALDLSAFVDKSFDGLLLLGPLYHLLRADERQQAVAEALRVLKPDGLLFSAFINIYSPFRDAIAQGFLQDYSQDPQQVQALVNHILTDQQVQTGFTDAWLAYPDQACALMEAVGARMLAMLSAEGIAAGYEHNFVDLEAAAFDFWADLNYRFCHDPHLLGSADHFLYIGKKGS